MFFLEPKFDPISRVKQGGPLIKVPYSIHTYKMSLHLIKTLTDKETKLLEALLKANRLKTLAERVRVLECERHDLHDSASWDKDDDPSKWPAEILECEALEKRVAALHKTQERIQELRLLLKTV